MQNGARTLELVELRKYSGASTDYYSNPDFNVMLGAADRIVIHVVVSDASGTSPTLSVFAEDASENVNWKDINSGTAIINAVTLASPPYVYRATIGSDSAPFGKYLRLRFVLGGTNPTATLVIRASLKNT